MSGAKNVALKTIIAALMFKGDVILKNVPQINDVLDLIELIKSLGTKAIFIEKNTLLINADSLKSNRVDLIIWFKNKSFFYVVCSVTPSVWRMFCSQILADAASGLDQLIGLLTV